MADEADETIVRYRRRLDRTPEKQFEKIPVEEKKLISSIRGAVENCRNKVDEMKDDIAHKEKIIDEERSRREKAEERLKQFLVDPYGSPAVNSELRDRLPRANKVDPLTDSKEAESCAEEELEEEIIPKSRAEPNNASSKHKSKQDTGGHGSIKKNVRRSLNFQTPPKPFPHSSRTSGDGGVEVETEDSVSEEEVEESRHHHHHHHHHHRSEARQSRGRSKKRGHSADYTPCPPGYPILPHPQHPPAAIGYPAGMYMSSPYRLGNLTPWSSASSFGLGSSYGPLQEQVPFYRVGGIPQSRSFPLLNSEVIGDVGPAAHLNAGVSDNVLRSASSGLHAASASTQEAMMPPSHNPDLGSTTNQTEGSQPLNSASQKPAGHSELLSNSASSLSSHYAIPTSLGVGLEASGGGGGETGERVHPGVQHVGIPPVYSGPRLASAVSSGFRDLSFREMSQLRDEIERLKETNRQLTQKLSAYDQEVESLKLQILAETPNDGSLDSDAARKFTELMTEVKAAERRRQETMEARVRQAEQDKEQIMQDFENALLKSSKDRESGRHLSRKDLSSASDSEDSEEEEEEEDEVEMDNVKSFTKRSPTKSPPAADADAGRVTSLKDALKELEKRQQRELTIYQEELQLAIEQRDQALEQLHEEKQKQQMQQLRVPAQREQMLMAKISALQREKDRAESTARELKEEQVETQLYISLHKALFPDSALNDNTKTSTGDSKLKMKLVEDDDVGDGEEMTKTLSMKEDNQLLEQLRQANQEKSWLQMRCQQLEALCKQEKEDKNRLERLNGVLRKKLFAVSSTSQQFEE